MENNKVMRGVVAALIMFAAIFILRRCDNKQVQEITNVSLKPGEREAVIVEAHTGTITTVKKVNKPGGGSQTVKETVTGARNVRISIDDKGVATVTAQTKGFSHNLGMTHGWAEKYRAGVDVEWAYWKQFGLLTGVSIPLEKPRSLALYVGGQYKLPWKITRNTGLFVSVDTHKNIYGGIRIEL